MKFVLAAVAAIGLAYSAQGQEITAVPRLSDIYADQVWVMHNGRVVRKVSVDSAAVFTLRGPLGGELTLCPPGGCPPEQQPPEQQPDPPQFPFPDEPTPDPAPEPEPDLTPDDSNLVGMVLAGGGTAGTVSGLIASLIVHFRRDDEDDEPQEEDEDEPNA